MNYSKHTTEELKTLRSQLNKELKKIVKQEKKMKELKEKIVGIENAIDSLIALRSLNS